MSKPSQLSQDQLASLKYKIDTSNELLGNLQAEIAAAQRDRDKIKAQQQHEADLIIQGRDKELAKRISEAEAAIAPLEAEADALKVSIRELARIHDEYVTENTKLEAETGSHRSTLATIRADVVGVKAEFDSIEATRVGAQAAVDELQESINRFQDRLQGLKVDVADLEKIKADLQTLNTRVGTEIQDKQAEAERALNNTIGEYNRVSRMAQEESKNLDAARSDIARRQSELDEREKVLKRREMKVSRDEATIQNNATLLNL